MDMAERSNTINTGDIVTKRIQIAITATSCGIDIMNDQSFTMDKWNTTANTTKKIKTHRTVVKKTVTPNTTAEADRIDKKIDTAIQVTF